jgi:hypothetical protein
MSRTKQDFYSGTKSNERTAGLLVNEIVDMETSGDGDSNSNELVGLDAKMWKV